MAMACFGGVMTRRVSGVLIWVCLALSIMVRPAAAQSGSISGTVTNGGATTAGTIASSAGIPGVSVFACNGDSCFGITTSLGPTPSFPSAPPIGTYTISGLPFGSYRLYTYSGYQGFDVNTGGAAFIDQFYRAGAIASNP